MNDNRVDFYGNSVSISTGLYDVTLHFVNQSAVVIQEGKTPIIETSGTCNVSMSPQHAKSLATLLVQHVLDYEKQFNISLPIPPNLMEIWKKNIK